MKKGILLINLGTPQSTAVADVRRYLRQFLFDPDVIDINPIGRWLLVNGIIAPFRAPKSAKLYREIWTPEGSPLLVYGIALRDKLQHALGDNYLVELGMRYQQPSIESVMRSMLSQGVTEIVAIPLYPQFAESTTGSTMKAIESAKKKTAAQVPVRIIGAFYDHPAYLEAFADSAKDFNAENYDHVLFSYHGVPERHIHKASQKYSMQCSLGECCSDATKPVHHCYRAHCVRTTQLIASRLGLSGNKYSMSFQSRLGRDPWVQPYSDETIKKLAESGVKKLLVFSPAFVADCLETIHEIGVEYDELFREHGGEKITLVPSLNSNDAWVKALAEIAG